MISFGHFGGLSTQTWDPPPTEATLNSSPHCRSAHPVPDFSLPSTPWAPRWFVNGHPDRAWPQKKGEHTAHHRLETRWPSSPQEGVSVSLGLLPSRCPSSSHRVLFLSSVLLSRQATGWYLVEFIPSPSFSYLVFATQEYA